MSVQRGRDSRADAIDDLLASLVGDCILGGCEDCDAWQDLTRDEFGIWHLTVMHDDGCPVLARHRRETS